MKEAKLTDRFSLTRKQILVSTLVTSILAQTPFMVLTFVGDTVSANLLDAAKEFCNGRTSDLKEVQTFALFGLDAPDSYKIVCNNGERVPYNQIDH